MGKRKRRRSAEAAADKNPTMQAIMQVARVFEGLGDFKPDTQTQADRQLNELARELDVTPDSLQKKVERLDLALGLRLTDLVKAWRDEAVSKGQWRTASEECKSQRNLLLAAGESCRRLLQRDRASRPVTIRVVSNRILKARESPEVLREFFRTEEGKNVHVELSSARPDTILEDAERSEERMVGRSTCTTCTRPCCTFWASTTRN